VQLLAECPLLQNTLLASLPVTKSSDASTLADLVSSVRPHLDLYQRGLEKAKNAKKAAGAAAAAGGAGGAAGAAAAAASKQPKKGAKCMQVRAEPCSPPLAPLGMAASMASRLRCVAVLC